MKTDSPDPDFRAWKDKLYRLSGRARLLCDIPGLIEYFRFRQLRRRYNELLWATAAKNIGARLCNWQSDFRCISRGDVATFVRGGEVMLDSHLTLELMGDKPLVYRLLGEKGLAVPANVEFSPRDLQPALQFLNGQAGPVVVKPASGTGGGRGVTTGISTQSDLRAAARRASRYDCNLIAERQIEGASYRLLFLHGRFVDAIRRDPPQLTGDGRRSIRQLIAEENVKRLAGPPFRALSPLTVDRDCRNYLKGQGLSLGARPGAGEVIQVKRAVNENSAAQNHGVREQVHPGTIALCRRLVVEFGVAFAGIDILCRDIALPLGAENGLISEINTTPGIHHHYLVHDAEAVVPVAELVLEDILSTGRGALRPGPSRLASPVGQARPSIQAA